MKSEIYVKPFKDYSSTWTFSVLPFHPLTRKNAWALLDSAWKYFCVLQHKQKFHITNLPIVYVDHPLDKTIPFVPSNIRIYMDFVNFFCRIIKMFVSRLKKDGYILSAKILEFIRKLYIDAAAVYTHSLSTTRRPFYLGKPKFFNHEYIKEGAVVIDVGIHRMENGKLCGDVDRDDVMDLVSAITPVPGGVGPMTIAMLMNNCIEAVKLQKA